MALKNLTVAIIFLLVLCLSFGLSNSQQQPWIKAGYWDSSSELPVSGIDSALFTHLICAFAYINSSTHHLFVNSTKQQTFSSFSSVVKRKNPSVITLLSVWCGKRSPANFSSVIDEASYRRKFVRSLVETARLYEFDGLDLCGIAPGVSVNMSNLGILFDEWKEAVVNESRVLGKKQLILVMSGYHLPSQDSLTYPIDSMRRNLDWVNFVAFDYYVPTENSFTAPHAALHGPAEWENTDHIVKQWLNGGFPASKLVLGLPYHGYLWNIANQYDNDIGSPSTGPAITLDGSMGYKAIKSLIQNYGYGAVAVYNSTYVVNFFTVGSTWSNFDDVEAIKAKVSYAKENNLSGCSVFQLSNDDNWILSRAANGIGEDKQDKKQALLIALAAAAVACMLVSVILCCCFKRNAKKFKDTINTIRRPVSNWNTKTSADGSIRRNTPSLDAFSFKSIKAATDSFSSENKIGEGGFGPVYKGKLAKGKEIAVNRLSKTSSQGIEELKNEVTVTERLQHVNLVGVLGFCTEREEKMLIYEYMPNKSLDFYLYDVLGRYLLDWKQCVHIIEGIIQGLLYLQEYSNYTIIHRDLKANNILLDKEMNPKISDSDWLESSGKMNWKQILAELLEHSNGYVPPEYVKRGIYSMKYDVYSFGVILLQIISGKKTTCYYGPNENLILLEYAYNLWKDGDGMEFIDPSLDDSRSSSKLMTCMQVGLLCVQENPLDRPSILQISNMLKNENNAATTMAIPKRPAFSVQRDEEEIKIYSVNEASITQLLPR